MDIRSKHITTNDIQQAAKNLGLDASSITEKRTTRNGTTWSGRLLLAGPNNKKEPHAYGRLNHRLDRCINAVCWHGFRDYMRSLLNVDPEAVIITGHARYVGRDDFEETHGDTAYVNIGSQMHPCYMMDACHCD